MRPINAKFDYMHYCCELRLPVGKISASSIWTAIFFKLFDSHVRSVFINACTNNTGSHSVVYCNQTLTFFDRLQKYKDPATCMHPGLLH